MIVKQLATTLMIGVLLMGIVAQACADVVPNLGRGVNFGNKLESPKGQPWGPLLEAWNFVKAKEGGFDTVRLPIRWHEYAADAAPYTIEAEFMDRVAWALEQALVNDLNVVFNVHHYNPLFENPQAEKAKFLAMWQQIAERFKDLPSDRVVFEVMNEPNGKLTAELWNEFFAEALALIRQSNPNRYVMVGSAEWGGVDAMFKLKLPADDQLIFTVHYYEPFQFTHQGAEWAAGSDNWCGTRWTATDAQQKFIRDRLDTVAAWAKAHNNIPVFLGEFGAYKKCALPEDQARWVDFIARESEKRGFSWAYWEFNAGFGCYGATKNEGWNYLHHALIPEAPEAPLPEVTPRPTAAPVQAGVNMLKNGDFAKGEEAWERYVHDYAGAEAKGSFVFTDEILTQVDAPGKEFWHVQFWQSKLLLEQGKTYTVSFDARVAEGSGRDIVCSLEMSQDPWQGYGSQQFTLTNQMATYTFSVKMEAATDPNARVVFNLGNSTDDVVVDNVSVVLNAQ